jgi:hypothetical protein
MWEANNFDSLCLCNLDSGNVTREMGKGCKALQIEVQSTKRKNKDSSQNIYLPWGSWVEMVC